MSAPLGMRLRDLPAQARSVIEAQGPDVLRFLQGLLSQDVEALKAGEARAATLLTVKGKICWDAVLCRVDKGHFLLAVPESEAEAALNKLDRHLIMDEVELRAADPGWSLAWSPSGVEPAEGLHTFETDYPLAGQLLWGPASLVDAALPKGEACASVAAWLETRIERGTPAWGFEVRADRFPPELGLVRAVSYDKGCFMGQEPLARIHARGKTNWVLVRLSWDMAAPLAACEPGAGRPLSAEGREAAGELTSWVEEDGRGRGLAIVHRSVSTDGATLGDAEGRVFRVEGGPLGDDPGSAANQSRR